MYNPLPPGGGFFLRSEEMVVIPGLRLPDMPSMAEFYVVDPRSLSYAISEGDGANLAIKVFVYVHGNYVGLKDYPCQNTAEARAVKAKFDQFNVSLMKWSPSSGATFLEMP